MSDAPTLRPYQREAIEAVLGARRRGVRRMLVCLPTGAGKTVVFAQLARMAKRPVVVIAHRVAPFVIYLALYARMLLAPSLPRANELP